MDQLIARIVNHSAFSHPVFAALAERKIPHNNLAAYLRLMGAFCEASRSPGRISEQLLEAGYPELADEVDAIFASESGHAREFALMVKDLLQLSDGILGHWENFARATLSSGGWVATSFLAEREAITSRHKLGEVLGMMLVVEMAAHRTIIPAQVKAFDESGLYPLTVGGSSYLDAHSGEDGAEHDHEARMTRVIASLQDSDVIWAGVEMGVTRFLWALNVFYDDLHTAIT